MLTKLHCIALRTVRVNDSRNLLSVWSREHGRLTFVMPAGNGREARRRRALTGPLALFEAVGDVRPDRDIITVRDLMPMPESPAMSMSPVRAASAPFLAEALDLLLRRTPADDILSAYLFDAISYYGTASTAAAANFHISFLYHLSVFLGIAPDIDEAAPGDYFDMREGRFISTAPLHGDYLSAADSRILLALARVPITHCGMLRVPRHERRRAIDSILHYYSLHLCELEGLQSLPILRRIFD